MMNPQHVMRGGMQLLTKNAPAVLTAFGAIGVVTTAVLVGKASFEACQVLSDAQFERNLKENEAQPFTKAEKVKLVWPLYIGAVTSGALSCGAIVMAHRLSSKRAAVLAAAYALNESKLEEYQDKIKEKFGIKKEKEARDEISSEKVAKTYDESTIIFSPNDGKVIIRDEYSGRYFWSSVEAVNKAVNDLNREIHMSVSSAQSLSDFYDLLELDHVSTSDHVGWNINDYCEIEWSTTTTPDGTVAVHSYEFTTQPILDPAANASFR